MTNSKMPQMHYMYPKWPLPLPPAASRAELPLIIAKENHSIRSEKDFKYKPLNGILHLKLQKNILLATEGESGQHRERDHPKWFVGGLSFLLDRCQRTVHPRPHPATVIASQFLSTLQGSQQKRFCRECNIPFLWGASYSSWTTHFPTHFHPVPAHFDP